MWNLVTCSVNTVPHFCQLTSLSHVLFFCLFNSTSVMNIRRTVRQLEAKYITVLLSAHFFSETDKYFIRYKNEYGKYY